MKNLNRILFTLLVLPLFAGMSFAQTLDPIEDGLKDMILTPPEGDSMLHDTGMAVTDGMEAELDDEMEAELDDEFQASEADSLRALIPSQALVIGDSGEEEPRLLPDSRFYFLKSIGRVVRSAVTIGTERQANLNEKFARDKDAEIRALVNKGNFDAASDHLESYQKEIDKVERLVDKLKEKRPEVAQRLAEEVFAQQFSHLGIYPALEAGVSAVHRFRVQEGRSVAYSNAADIATAWDDAEVIEVVNQTLKEWTPSKRRAVMEAFDSIALQSDDSEDRPLLKQVQFVGLKRKLEGSDRSLGEAEAALLVEFAEADPEKLRRFGLGADAGKALLTKFGDTVLDTSENRQTIMEETDTGLPRPARAELLDVLRDTSEGREDSIETLRVKYELNTAREEGDDGRATGEREHEPADESRTIDREARDLEGRPDFSPTSRGSGELLDGTKALQDIDESFNLEYLKLQEKLKNQSDQFNSVSDALQEKHEAAGDAIDGVRGEGETEKSDTGNVRPIVEIKLDTSGSMEIMPDAGQKEPIDPQGNLQKPIPLKPSAQEQPSTVRPSTVRDGQAVQDGTSTSDEPIRREGSFNPDLKEPIKQPIDIRPQPTGGSLDGPIDDGFFRPRPTY